MVHNDEILCARILIVDDKEPNVLMLEQLLRTEGYDNLTCTQNPFSVCELHGAQPFDLILLDLQMPGMDGFAVMQGLQAVDPHGYVPVLAITVQPNHKLRALKSGAKDFIAKPFDLVEVKTRIRNMIEVRLLYKSLGKAVHTLESLALHDELTGLPNRRLLMDRLRHAMLTSARTGHHVALLFLDLNRFKQLNDTHGHEVGDLLLQQVGERLHACVRDGDSVARLGGDEFVVLLEALSTDERDAATQAEVIACKMQAALAQPFNLGGVAHSSTASMGLVVFLGGTCPLDALLKKADMAMYQAKVAGGNAVCFFDPAMQAAVAAHDVLAKDLHRALAMQEFVLHYQIQVNHEGTPTGVEALVRWNHPTRGLIHPAQFIGLAEKIGLMWPLGCWVLEAACLQLVQWADQASTAGWTMAVNVSNSQFAHPDFVAQIGQLLHSTGANPKLLRLELAQDTLLADMEGGIATMNVINALGVDFALDDFGTDLTPLTHLKRLPLGQFKIDQALVRNFLTEPSDAILAHAFVALGSSLGFGVIAKGVDTAKQRDFLARMGCTAYQGYLFGYPVSASELQEIYMQ